MYIHDNVIKELRNLMKEVAGEDPQEEWLAPTPDEFEKLKDLVQEDLVKPTSNLSDLVSLPRIGSGRRLRTSLAPAVLVP